MALVLTLMLVSVAVVQAKKPFRFEVEGSPIPKGWIATITSGIFTGYTMYWYQPIVEFKNGNVYFFEEWWIEDGNGKEILRGYDEGVTRMKNGKFIGNGKVTYAMEGYEHLIGLKEQCEGTVDFDTMTFTGTIQIN